MLLEIERLKIFVSGKEDELVNERVTVRDLIINMGYVPKGSEGRSASNSWIVDKYRKEVIESDIYIGIFGKIDSPPSLDEFDKARERGKPTLVFIKSIKNSELRQPLLSAFIDKMHDGRIPIVYKNFTHVIDLRNEVQKAIIETITERFRTVKEEA